jgi:hypothetical protein
VKKHILTIAAGLVLAVAPLHAQEVHFGLRASGGGSFFEGDASLFNVDREQYTASLRRRPSWEGSAFLQVAWGPHFALRPEIGYVQKGARLQETHRQLAYSDTRGEYFNETVSTVEETVRLSYLQGALLTELSLPIEAAVTPSVQFGPAVGVTVSATAHSEVTSQIPEFEGGTYEDPIETAAVDLGVIWGLGLRYEFDAGGAVFLDVRYEIGGTDVSPRENAGISPVIDFRQGIVSLRNERISVGGGVQFAPW